MITWLNTQKSGKLCGREVGLLRLHESAQLHSVRGEVASGHHQRHVVERRALHAVHERPHVGKRAASLHDGASDLRFHVEMLSVPSASSSSSPAACTTSLPSSIGRTTLELQSLHRLNITTDWLLLLVSNYDYTVNYRPFDNFLPTTNRSLNQQPNWLNTVRVLTITAYSGGADSCKYPLGPPVSVSSWFWSNSERLLGKGASWTTGSLSDCMFIQFYCIKIRNFNSFGKRRKFPSWRKWTTVAVNP